MSDKEFKAETGKLRKIWVYFKKGKNEINFILNIYQTLILILSMSFIGKMPLGTIVLITILFGLFFFVIAVWIGKYSANKVDPSLYFVTPYFVDQSLYRLNLLRALYAMNGNNQESAIMYIEKGINIMERWVKKNEERI